ncbi:MAG: transglutaminase domain-containing protein [Clostridia bacterium]|nr:transglutaminase domain-containing protein [Clostridia bacterium]
MNAESNKYEYLSYPLPEDVLRAKYAGDTDALLKLIKARTDSPLTHPLLKKRLEYEGEICALRERRYKLTRAQTLEKLRERVPDFKDEELDKYEREGMCEYVYLRGEKRYLTSCPGTLIKYDPALAKREINAKNNPAEPDLDEFICAIKSKGEFAMRYEIESTLKLDDECFIPGETYTVHIPVPAKSAQQSADKIRICADADALVSAPDSCQRCVCYVRKLNKNAPFGVSFTYESRLKYVNPLKDEAHIVYPGENAPSDDDLSEQLPHIRFTPYIKRLAQDIKGSETRPLYIAKRIYDYITTNVRYSFMPPYRLIENQAEYAAVNMKGDCGIQAILFITLCRALGVPARWQSGLTVDRESCGEHDWAQFYTSEFGWLFADPSYGGGAHRRGNEERREYYFGNLDPYRMVANRRYMTDAGAPKRFLRYDPCDSQDGEIECGARGFDISEFGKTDFTKVFEEI